MSDDSPQPHPGLSLMERLRDLFTDNIADSEELIRVLRKAQRRKVLDSDALGIIEGALQVADMQVRDIMIPRSQMDVIDINQKPDEFIPEIIATAHSRFPVIDKSRDDVIGVLLAKDLLRYYAGEEEFNVRDMLRPAVFVPESKPLNVLLREFRASRNHMAIVVDEYGGVCGLITIEDVLEQIVGDIEDEYDFDESGDNILREENGNWRVKAQTEIADFNDAFGTAFSDDEYDTLGGLLIARFGRLPKRGESLSMQGLRFQVLRADSRRLHVVQVQRLAEPA
jgi:magnesium and cobalt transporter